MRTRAPQRVGYRYIEADWGDDDHPPLWHLWIDGQHTATAAITSLHPPFVLTEGLPFRPQWHSAMSEEPDSWVYRPPELRIRRPRRAFWPALVAALVLGAIGVAYKPALLGAAVLLAVAVADEVRRMRRA